MRVVLTLLVRDEIDLVDAFLRYHLDRGVDFVIATDHRSVDGTTDVLRAYERDGALRLIPEREDAIRQVEWVTRMARLAATDHGADWVVNADADEFFWPRDGELREVLEAVPPRFGVVHGFWRHFVPRPETGEPFHVRMTARRRASDVPTSQYVGAVKAVHRADPEVVVGRGNHKAFGRGLVPLRDWLAFDVLHFPIRTREQFERKFRRLAASPNPEVGLTRHEAAIVAILDASGADDAYRRALVEDGALAQGVADGSLTIDTRLRDYLVDERQTAPPLALADDAALASEAAGTHASDSVVRLRWNVARLAERLEAAGAAR